MRRILLDRRMAARFFGCNPLDEFPFESVIAVGFLAPFFVSDRFAGIDGFAVGRSVNIAVGLFAVILFVKAVYHPFVGRERVEFLADLFTAVTVHIQNAMEFAVVVLEGIPSGA